MGLYHQYHPLDIGVLNDPINAKETKIKASLLMILKYHIDFTYSILKFCIFRNFGCHEQSNHLFLHQRGENSFTRERV